MKRAILWLSVLLFAVALAIGCHLTLNAPGPTGPISDAGADEGPYRGEHFPDELTAALVARVSTCCTNAGVTADPAKLAKAFEAGWINQSNSGVTDDTLGVVLGTSTVIFDPANAADCLSRISTMTCQNISEAEYNAITYACFEAWRGAVPTGSPCTYSVQCPSSDYCDLSVPGGDCVPLVATWDTCSMVHGEYQCSHRGNGGPCAGGECSPGRPEGATITSTPLECAAGMLSTGATCAAVNPSATYSGWTAGLCGMF